jgi:carbonic anhydrase
MRYRTNEAGLEQVKVLRGDVAAARRLTQIRGGLSMPSVLAALRAYRTRAAESRSRDAAAPVSALFVICSEHASANALVAAVEPALVLQNLGARVPAERSGDSGDFVTVEVAFELVGVRHVVVVGHSGCCIRPEVPGDDREHLHDDRFTPEKRASQASLLLQVARVQAHARAADRRVQVHALWFDEEEGDVYAYRPDAHRFALFSDLDAERLFDGMTAATC